MLIGLSISVRVLVVCHCYRQSDEVIRIISARKAGRDEKRYDFSNPFAIPVCGKQRSSSQSGWMRTRLPISRDWQRRMEFPIKISSTSICANARSLGRLST